MTYDTLDKSASSSRPIELVTFETPLERTYLTSFNRDVRAQRWDDPATLVNYVTTKGLSRSSLPVVAVGQTSEINIEMPCEHPVAQQVLAGVTFLRKFMLCTILRMQQSTGEIVPYWQGFVTSTNAAGRKVQLRVPDFLDEALDLDVPNGAVSKTCNRVLFDRLCRIKKDDFKTPSSYVSNNGVFMVVSTVGSMPTAGYFDNGYVEHPASGELRTIITADKASKTLTLDSIFPTDIWTKTGSLAVNLYSGCDHTIDGVEGCVKKYDNRINFGGHPQLPVSNPWIVSFIGNNPAK